MRIAALAWWRLVTRRPTRGPIGWGTSSVLGFARMTKQTTKIEYTAEQVETARKASGLDRDEAAQLAGVSKRTWDGWGSGRFPINRRSFELFLLLTGQFQVTRFEPAAKPLQRGNLVLRLSTDTEVRLRVTAGGALQIAHQILEVIKR